MTQFDLTQKNTALWDNNSYSVSFSGGYGLFILTLHGSMNVGYGGESKIAAAALTLLDPNKISLTKDILCEQILSNYAVDDLLESSQAVELPWNHPLPKNLGVSPWSYGSSSDLFRLYEANESLGIAKMRPEPTVQIELPTNQLQNVIGGMALASYYGASAVIPKLFDVLDQYHRRHQ